VSLDYAHESFNNKVFMKNTPSTVPTLIRSLAIGRCHRCCSIAIICVRGIFIEGVAVVSVENMESSGYTDHKVSLP
jgi:hypothetical protein